MKAFLCHSSSDSRFVTQVASYLSTCIETFYYEEHQRADQDFTKTINNNWDESSVFIVFIGETYEESKWQQDEVSRLQRTSKERDVNIYIVPLSKNNNPINIPEPLKGRFIVNLGQDSDYELQAYECTEKIVLNLRNNRPKEVALQWPPDGLPTNPHLFSYEKKIIEFYKRTGELGNKLFLKGTSSEDEERKIYRTIVINGCPLKWPSVYDLTVENDLPTSANVLSEKNVGKFRNRSAYVSTAALNDYDTKRHNLFLLEAGPREELAFPLEGGSNTLNVGIVVTGGIAPGVNAVIDGIVQRHWQYAGGPQQTNHELNVLGYVNGFLTLETRNQNRRQLVPDENYKSHTNPLQTSEHAINGGSILGTYRLESLLNRQKRHGILKMIANHLSGIDILYVIGGDGSMRAAHALWNIAKEEKDRKTRPLSVVAIPKTMDNDILWVWQSFGFLSAVEKAREIVEQLHTEVSSNPRLCVLQLFGSDSGFVVSHAVLASAVGHCDLALIPEVPFSLIGIATYLKKIIIDKHRQIPHALVVMAETAVPVDAVYYLGDKKYPCPIDDINHKALDLGIEEKNAIREFNTLKESGKRIEGQTSDALRRGCLKIVLGGLQQLLISENFKTFLYSNKLISKKGFKPQWHKLRVFSNEPRHLVRTMQPSTLDIINGQRLGMLAVDNAMAGYTDFMISQWLTEFVLVPLPLVVLGRKRIPKGGIFWNSVLSKTGQPENLVYPWNLVMRSEKNDAVTAVNGGDEIQ